MHQDAPVSLAWDFQEDRKLAVFGTLIQLAKARGVSIIHLWRLKKNYCQDDDLYFQSSGPPKRRASCVLCGRRALGPYSIKMGEFSCHDDCFHERFVEVSGHGFLVQTEYRPPVIILDCSIPGSLDNAVMGLAWGLGVYRSTLRRAEDWDDTSAPYFAKRLVRLIERQILKHKAFSAPVTKWVF